MVHQNRKINYFLKTIKAIGVMSKKAKNSLTVTTVFELSIALHAATLTKNTCVRRTGIP